MEKYKILVYGCDLGYEKVFNNLLFEQNKGNIEIVGTISDDLSYKSVDNHDVISVEQINDYDFDYVIVTETDQYRQISETLCKIGISRDKIINAAVLQIPYFDFRKYVKLRNEKVSIICNNCWGGFTYHSLDLEFNSPFVNMCMSDENYFKLLGNFKFYINQPFEFKYTNKDAMSPICSIGDIELHCNHYRTYEEAKEKWEKRVQKINYDNLFFMYYTDDKSKAEKFNAIDLPKKVLFTSFESNLDSAISFQFFQLNTVNNKYRNQFWELINNIASGKRCLNYNIFKLLQGETPATRFVSISAEEVEEINNSTVYIQENNTVNKNVFLHKLFSVTNEYPHNHFVKHKIIYFLGLKFVIKIVQK